MRPAALRRRVLQLADTVAHMHVLWRVYDAIGNQAAAQLARENRDIARRMHLEAFADELLACPRSVS